MGMSLSYLPFFDLLDSFYPLRGRAMAALGSQAMHDPAEALADYAARSGHARFAAAHTVENLFRERYGLKDYQDFDLNDSAAVKLDLSQPVPASCHAAYDIVFDGGTTEHIFDVATVFRNMHAMLRPDGIFISMSPFSWMDHGFYNFNPRFFRFLDKANGYIPLIEGYYFQPDPASPFSGFCYSRVNGTTTPEADALRNELARPSVRTNTLYIRVSRKPGATAGEARDFALPFDVYD